MQDLQNAVLRESAKLLVHPQDSFAFVTVYALTLMIAVMIFHEVTALRNQTVSNFNIICINATK